MSSFSAPSSLQFGTASRAPALGLDALRLAPLVALYFVLCLLLQPGAEAVRDEPALIAAAERLFDHGQLVAAGTDPDQRAWLWHGPGLAVLLAPLVALDVPLTALRLIEPLLLGVAVVLFHRLLRHRLAPRPALFWTYALGLYAPAYLMLGTIQKEPLAIVLVLVAMLGVSSGLRTGRRVPLAGAGLALAALAMVRLEYGWVIMALVGSAAVWWLARPARRQDAARLALVAGVALLACVPWLAYTWNASGKPLYWSASSGLSLFWMSPTVPGETGQWHSPLRVYRDPALSPYRPLFHRLDEVHPLESDRVLRRLAVQNIRERPLTYARNVAANTGRLFFWVPNRSNRSNAAVALLVVFNGALLLALAAAARALWRRRGTLPPETGAFALFAALAIAVHLPPSASPRMLFPVVPILVWLVAVGLSRRDAGTGAADGRPER